MNPKNPILGLKNPPSALFKAKLDNISIVPGSMLPANGKFESLTTKIPSHSVLLCHSSASQKKILENVANQFRQKGHRVTIISSEGFV